MNGLKMEKLTHQFLAGSFGEFGVEINVGATKLPDLESDAIREVAFAAADMVKKAIMEAIIRSNPEAMAYAKEEREQLVRLFNQPVFVEEIPNGYCSDYCCKHKPWFVVTTPKGKFTIGWRKRVIQIQWPSNFPTANELFPKEDVTKWERMIHAWSLADAKRYIDTVLGSIQ